MATKTYKITSGMGQLTGVERKFPLSLAKPNPVDDIDDIKEITGIKITRYHASNLPYTWYLKVAFSRDPDGNSLNCISADNRSINSTSWVNKPAYFRTGKRTYIRGNGSTYTLDTLPTVQEWKEIVSGGSLLLLASNYGHDYLGYVKESGSYSLLTLVNEDHPIEIIVTYEEKNTQPFTIESLSATRTDNSGNFNVSLKINYSDSYVFTDKDVMSCTLSASDSNISNKSFNFTSQEWGEYKAGSSFNWSGADKPNVDYTITIIANVNGESTSKKVILPQLSGTSDGTVGAGGETNFHLAGSGKGVGVGGLSKGTVANPHFDCYYNSEFYKNVTVDGSLVAKNIALSSDSTVPKILYGSTEQFGLSGGNPSTLTVNFDAPFTTPPIVTVTLHRSGGADRLPSCVLTNISENSFTISCDQSSASGTTNYSARWIAIGI